MSSISQSSKPYLVLSTINSNTKAHKIAKTLLQEKLAACVSIVPGLDSIFRWRGKIDHAREFLLVIKTRSNKLKLLEKKIRKLHSYDVPEIIGVPISWGHRPYLKWLQDSVS